MNRFRAGRTVFRVSAEGTSGTGDISEAFPQLIYRSLSLRVVTKFIEITAVLISLFATGGFTLMAAESDPRHRDARAAKPSPWPGGIVPYDISRLTAEQQKTVRAAMDRWEETGANIRFVVRTNEQACVFFTGRTDAGNNTSQVGFVPGKRVDINITAFWWRQGEWMAAHELGHVLGFFHEHARWDRDQFVTIHYENIKEGREHDYDWVPQTNWITSATSYDYRSIMHYRVCWTGRCESECKDGKGDSPCAVIDPLGLDYDGVIGQWGDNRISAGDAEKAWIVYGTKSTARARPDLK